MCIIKKIATFGIIYFILLQTLLGQSNQIDSLQLILSKDSNQISVLNNIANAFIQIDPQKAMRYAKKAMQKESKKNSPEKSKSLRILLEAAIRDKDIEQINKTQKELLEYPQDVSPFEKANLLFCKGLLNYKSSSYSDASINFFDALKFFELSKHDIEYCQILKYIGITYYHQFAPKKALKYYRMSLENALENNFPNEIALGYNNVAAVYNEQKLYKKAIYNFNKSLEINKINKNTHLESINYLNLGIVERNLGNDKKSLTYFHKVLNTIGPNSSRIKAAAYNFISKYFLNKNKLDTAIYFAKKTLNLKEKPIAQSIRSTKLLKTIYLKLRDTSSAYNYEIQNRFLTDSFYEINNLMRTNFTELQYDLDKKERQLIYKSKQNKLVYTILGLVLLLLIILARFIYNKLKFRLTETEKDKQIIKNTLSLKNKELTAKALYLIQKNESMMQISNELNNLAKQMESQIQQKKIQKIASKLNKSTNEEVWKEFELYFQSVHSNFYSNLQTQFPNLTTNEKKLAAFLCMNMSSKEISAITGQRIATLEVARSRLRKKLGISKQDISLPNFLAQFCSLS